MDCKVTVFCESDPRVSMPCIPGGQEEPLDTRTCKVQNRDIAYEGYRKGGTIHGGEGKEWRKKRIESKFKLGGAKMHNKCYLSVSIYLSIYIYRSIYLYLLIAWLLSSVLAPPAISVRNTLYMLSVSPISHQTVLLLLLCTHYFLSSTFTPFENPVVLRRNISMIKALNQKM